MGRRTRARQRRYEDAQEPWLLREVGGAPVWMLLAGCAVIVVVVVFAFLQLT